MIKRVYPVDILSFFIKIANRATHFRRGSVIMLSIMTNFAFTVSTPSIN